MEAAERARVCWNASACRARFTRLLPSERGRKAACGHRRRAGHATRDSGVGWADHVPRSSRAARAGKTPGRPAAGETPGDARCEICPRPGHPRRVSSIAAVWPARAAWRKSSSASIGILASAFEYERYRPVVSKRHGHVSLKHASFNVHACAPRGGQEMFVQRASLFCGRRLDRSSDGAPCGNRRTT